MDLSYGSEYETFRREVQDFLKMAWVDVGEWANTGCAERVAEFRLLATERGYLYRNIPKQYGGSEQAADSLKAQIIQEEFARVRAPMEVPGQGTGMLVQTLLECGAEWQKEKFIPPTVRGEYRWAQGYSEPGAGSDLASLRTRAELDGDEWVINGQKVWTSGATECNYMFALVRTEPEAPRHEGISYMLLPLDQPGIEIRPLKQITGEEEFTEVFLNNARTPAHWIVGERGEGWIISRTTLKHERRTIAGHSEQLFSSLLKLAKRATVDGKPALENQYIRIQLAELQAWLLEQRYVGYYRMSVDHNGGDAGNLEMMGKLITTEFAQKLAGVAYEIIGNDGMLAPPRKQGSKPGNERWTNQFLNSLALAIGGGTSNIQRNIIAERGLGLPRDQS